MISLRVTGLRARLVLLAVAGSVLVLGVLIAGFNAVLESRLRRDADNVLRERAAAQLQTLVLVEGRLRVRDAPDNAAQDTQTWIFAGRVPVERPGGDPRNQGAALALIARAPRLHTVEATDMRFDAVPVIEGRRRLGTLVVAASLSPYENTARTALVASLILGILTVIAITAASWWIIRRALAPVARMTAKAADWGEHDLSRRFYAGEPNDELSALAATFDQLLERLWQSLKREQRFTGEISHELRTPLAKIIAEAELAASRERTPEAYRAALDSIRFAAEQLHGALDALLAAARTDSTNTESAIDARTIAERAAQAARDLTDGHEVNVEVHGSGAGVRVAIEPDIIERALAPILDNAIRHARHSVEIGVSAENGQLLFEIRDDGPGVPPEIRQRIFEPGVSRRSASNGVGSGAGLGLPLARRLAQVAGGDVECQSSSAGGSFRVRFPLL